MSITSSGLVEGEYGFLYLWDGDGALDVTEDTKADSVLLQNADAGVATFTITNSVDVPPLTIMLLHGISLVMLLCKFGTNSFR